MRKHPLWRFGVLFALACLWAGCAGTRIEQKTVNDAFRGKPVSDILVIGITYRPEARQAFENRFVDQLKAVGVDAVSSTEAIEMPPDLKVEKPAILEAMRRYGSDGVIVTHVKGVESQSSESRFSPREAGFYGDYGLAFSPFGYEPGHYRQRTVARLETNLYHGESEVLMWSGLSETYNPGDPNEVIDQVVGGIVQDLLKTGMIAPR